MTTAEISWTWAWLWWGILVAINTVNLAICLILFARSRKDHNHTDSKYRRLMSAMGLVFIIVAFYRSVFISSYLEQLAWFNSILNSSLLIRSLAIFAELAFAGLIAKSLLRMNDDVPELINTKYKLAAFLQTKTPIIFFACILVANVFATSALITKIDLLFAIEETLWGLGFLSIVPMLIMSISKLFSNQNMAARPDLRQFKILVIILGVFSIGYSFYSVFYHLPIEIWPSAIAQLQMGNLDHVFRFGTQAIRDALFIVNETKDLSAWGGIGFIIWHTGYFSICGWMVLFLMTGPRLSNNSKNSIDDSINQ